MSEREENSTKKLVTLPPDFFCKAKKFPLTNFYFFFSNSFKSSKIQFPFWKKNWMETEEEKQNENERGLCKNMCFYHLSLTLCLLIDGAASMIIFLLH